MADAALLNNRGSVLQALGRGEEALASYGKAAEAAPDNAAIWKNRGHLLRGQHRHAEALASYDRAIALGADDAEIWDDRGAALHGMKRFDEALASFDRAIAAEPNYAPAWFHKGLEYLTRGELETGWPFWEWRQKLPSARIKHFAQPLWRGEDLRGKTLFVWWEEGFGDAILCFRFCFFGAGAARPSFSRCARGRGNHRPRGRAAAFRLPHPAPEPARGLQEPA
jgi:tetratricopeptide (TPR) repeat protein